MSNQTTRFTILLLVCASLQLTHAIPLDLLKQQAADGNATDGIGWCAVHKSIVMAPGRCERSWHSGDRLRCSVLQRWYRIRCGEMHCYM